MVEIIIFHHSTSHIHHYHLSLLTLCGKRVKQSQTVRSGQFESNLLTWPDRPKHTSHDYSQSHTCNISLQFPLHGTGPPPSTTRIHATVRRRVVSLLAPACGRMRNNVQRRWEGMFRLRFNPLLKLTDYHISRHVISTFKSLTTTTTHCGLIRFH